MKPIQSLNTISQHMKRIFTYSMLVIFIASCGAGGGKETELEKKQKELDGKKTELEKIQKDIAALEAEIATLDTSTGSSLKSKIVTVDTLRLQPFTHYIEIQGQVDSDENVFVSPETPGVITSIRVKEGDKVSKGTVMASSDAGALQNTLDEVKTALVLSTTAYEKQKRLWDQKIGSEMQYLQAKANKESMESRLASIESQINMTRIKSPISGTVDEVKVKLGEMGSPGMNGIRVVNLDKMKVVANVADTYMKRLKKGSPVIVELPDIDKTIEAKITFVSQVVNPQNRSLTIEVGVSNKDKMLKPNMIAKVKIQDELVDTAVVVPSNIIQRSSGGGEYILIAEKDNTGKLFARKREIRTGSNYGGKAVILSGLQAGDVIILSGYQEIVDGQPIYMK